MRERCMPQLETLPSNYNTPQLLLDRIARNKPQPVYSVYDPNAETWVDVTGEHYKRLVTDLAKALIAHGFEEGSVLAIMAPTSFEWALAEQAAWFAGGISVSIYETSSISQIEWILTDSGASHLLTQTPDASDPAAQAVANLSADRAPRHLRMDVVNDAGHPATVLYDGVPVGAGLADLMASGRDSGVPDGEVNLRRSRPGLNDPATLVYTSGTVGRPKGCIITHGNITLVAVNLVEHLSEVVGENGRTALFLPLAHILARAVQHACMYRDITVSHCSPRTVTRDLPNIKPTFLLAVPRIYEKLMAGALAKAETDGKGWLFRRARYIATRRGRAEDQVRRGQQKPRSNPLHEAEYRLYNKLVYPKIREIMGGEVRYSISGASPLFPDLAHFFNAIGLGVLEGYGLTETTAPLSVNMPGIQRVGSVGLPIPGTCVRIADDGEILVKGIGVFAGYWNNPEATQEAFNDEGFFYTGDLGELDEDGFLTVTGRKKDIIVTAGGKNVVPGPLEEIVREGRIVSQVVLLGDDKPFVSALVTLDEDELHTWAKAEKVSGVATLADAVRNMRVHEEIQSYINRANSTVSRAESIRKFVILDEDFSEDEGTLTPSMKVRRPQVYQQYADTINTIYRKRS